MLSIILSILLLCNLVAMYIDRKKLKYAGKFILNMFTSTDEEIETAIRDAIKKVYVDYELKKEVHLGFSETGIVTCILHISSGNPEMVDIVGELCDIGLELVSTHHNSLEKTTVFIFQMTNRL